MMITITKRDGRKETFQIEKIRTVIEYACEGLEVNPLELEAKFDEFLTDGITTTQIQDNLIYHARTLSSPQTPDWNFVAGRLATMNRWHETGAYDLEFPVFLNDMIEAGVYQHPNLLKWTEKQIRKVGDAIVQERDLDLSYAAVINAEKKYLLEGECLQQLFMVNAMILCTNKKNRVREAIRLYDALSQRKLSLATPWLSNLRKGKNINSCYILDIDDDLNSIYDNVKNAAMISQQGGGIGIHVGRIRARGSSVAGHKGGSKGVVPLLRVVNDTMVYIDQSSRRPGAATTTLPIWHADIEAFLSLQTEGGDLREKCFDIFPQVKIHDLFMKRVLSDGDWYTFCPHEVKTVIGGDLNEVYGTEFTKLYTKCCNAYESGRLTVGNKYKAKDLLKELMRVQVETGLPYIMFADTVHRYNPNKHDVVDGRNVSIQSLNLCVTGDTKILTDKGYVEIGSLVGTKQTIWNGEEWSEDVEIVQTGKNMEVLEVTVNYGQRVKCTPYHKFAVYDDDNKIIKVPAYKLKKGDRLIDYTLPNGERSTGMVVESVVKLDGLEDVFCFTEPKRNMGMFNGICTFQCVESYSNVLPDKLSHACSLASVVVGRHDSLEEIVETAKLAADTLNAGFDLFESPVQSAKANADRYRTIGVGIMGLHDWLAKNGYHYTQLEHISDVAESIAYGATLASIEMAKEHGKYDAFDGSMWDTGEMTDRFSKYGRLYDWKEVQRLIDEHGMYNGCVTMCAPTSSTSLLQDATAGIMPTYSAYYTEKNAVGTYAVSPENLRYNPLAYARTMPMYDQKELVDVVATIQHFMTAGISAEYVFDFNKEGFTAKDIYDMIVKAWKSETKAIYYIRSIKRGTNIDSLIGGESACVGCSG